MDYYEIGQRIRKARKARGLSQEALAELVSISTTHMSHIETGSTKLSLSVLVNLAEALNVRTDDLLLDRNSSDRKPSTEAILKIFDTCTPQQMRILEDVLKATKKTLEQNL